MVIYIKNMLSSRCKMIVELELERLGFKCKSIEIGKAEIIEDITSDNLDAIKTALLRCGLELIENKRKVLVDRIKNVVFEMIQESEKQTKSKFSDYLVSRLDHDYTYLANVFSEMESSTIEQFIISTRIQVAKDLLANGEMNLTEISWKLNYSSVAHLSTQFKKIVGITPSEFKCNTVRYS